MKTFLSRLNPKETGLVTATGGKGAFRRRLLDMGITPGAKITIEKYAPLGDPIQISLRGYSLFIRKEDADRISVEAAEKRRV